MNENIKGVELKLSDGVYTIEYGDDFSVDSGDVPFMVFVENNIWHVISDPERKSGNNARITLPRGFNPEGISLFLKNVRLYSGGLNGYIVELKLKNSEVKLNKIKAQHIKTDMSRGCLRMNAAPGGELYLDCGFGRVELSLAGNKRGYMISSICGAGSVTLNGKKTGREYKDGTAGVKVNIRCGLGDIIITK